MAVNTNSHIVNQGTVVVTDSQTAEPTSSGVKVVRPTGSGTMRVVSYRSGQPGGGIRRSVQRAISLRERRKLSKQELMAIEKRMSFEDKLALLLSQKKYNAQEVAAIRKNLLKAELASQQKKVSAETVTLTQLQQQGVVSKKVADKIRRQTIEQELMSTRGATTRSILELEPKYRGKSTSEGVEYTNVTYQSPFAETTITPISPEQRKQAISDYSTLIKTPRSDSKFIGPVIPGYSGKVNPAFMKLDIQKETSQQQLEYGQNITVLPTKQKPPALGAAGLKEGIKEMFARPIRGAQRTYTAAQLGLLGISPGQQYTETQVSTYQDYIKATPSQQAKVQLAQPETRELPLEIAALLTPVDDVLRGAKAFTKIETPATGFRAQASYAKGYIQGKIVNPIKDVISTKWGSRQITVEGRMWADDLARINKKYGGGKNFELTGEGQVTRLTGEKLTPEALARELQEAELKRIRPYSGSRDSQIPLDYVIEVDKIKKGESLIDIRYDKPDTSRMRQGVFETSRKASGKQEPLAIFTGEDYSEFGQVVTKQLVEPDYTIGRKEMGLEQVGLYNKLLDKGTGFKIQKPVDLTDVTITSKGKVIPKRKPIDIGLPELQTTLTMDEAIPSGGLSVFKRGEVTKVTNKRIVDKLTGDIRTISDGKVISKSEVTDVLKTLSKDEFDKSLNIFGTAELSTRRSTQYKLVDDLFKDTWADGQVKKLSTKISKGDITKEELFLDVGRYKPKSARLSDKLLSNEPQKLLEFKPGDIDDLVVFRKTTSDDGTITIGASMRKSFFQTNKGQRPVSLFQVGGNKGNNIFGGKGRKGFIDSFKPRTRRNYYSDVYGGRKPSIDEDVLVGMNTGSKSRINVNLGIRGVTVGASVFGLDLFSGSALENNIKVRQSPRIKQDVVQKQMLKQQYFLKTAIKQKTKQKNKKPLDEEVLFKGLPIRNVTKPARTSTPKIIKNPKKRRIPIVVPVLTGKGKKKAKRKTKKTGSTKLYDVPTIDRITKLGGVM